MSNQNNNPFSLPGFGQAGDLSQNPLLASMDMMRQAWQSLAGSGVLTQPPVTAGLTTEDLDRRISDLRAVENWLRINMSMLTSSIQALEVQRATIATLKSFANVPGAPSDAADNPSPLEVALGIKPSGQARIKTPEQVPGRDSAASAEPPASAGGGDSAMSAPPDPAMLAGAAQGWWDMLQKQFDTLAAATVAGMQAGQPDAEKTKGPAPRKAPGRSTASKTSAKTRTPVKAKTAAKRATAKKTVAKAAPRKRTAQ